MIFLTLNQNAIFNRKDYRGDVWMADVACTHASPQVQPLAEVLWTLLPLSSNRIPQVSTSSVAASPLAAILSRKRSSARFTLGDGRASR